MFANWYSELNFFCLATFLPVSAGATLWPFLLWRKQKKSQLGNWGHFYTTGCTLLFLGLLFATHRSGLSSSSSRREDGSRADTDWHRLSDLIIKHESPIMITELKLNQLQTLRREPRTRLDSCSMTRRTSFAGSSICLNPAAPVCGRSYSSTRKWLAERRMLGSSIYWLRFSLNWAIKPHIYSDMINHSNESNSTEFLAVLTVSLGGAHIRIENYVCEERDLKVIKKINWVLSTSVSPWCDKWAQKRSLVESVCQLIEPLLCRATTMLSYYALSNLHLLSELRWLADTHFWPSPYHFQAPGIQGRAINTRHHLLLFVTYHKNDLIFASAWKSSP